MKTGIRKQASSVNHGVQSEVIPTIQLEVFQGGRELGPLADYDKDTTTEEKQKRLTRVYLQESTQNQFTNLLRRKNSDSWTLLFPGFLASEFPKTSKPPCGGPHTFNNSSNHIPTRFVISLSRMFQHLPLQITVSEHPIFFKHVVRQHQ